MRLSASILHMISCLIMHATCMPDALTHACKLQTGCYCCWAVTLGLFGHVDCGWGLSSAMARGSLLPAWHAPCQVVHMMVCWGMLSATSAHEMGPNLHHTDSYLHKQQWKQNMQDKQQRMQPAQTPPAR